MFVGVWEEMLRRFRAKMAGEAMNTKVFHDEIVSALRPLGNPKLGKAIRADRGSCLDYLGVRFPALRSRVKQGFSFTSHSPKEVLAVWSELWRTSPWGDVLFAALEYYIPIVRKKSDPELWPVMKHWINRVDNWCHCDSLAGIYSHLLEQQFDVVYPQLLLWNRGEELWARRASLVSLVHYSGKNAVFLEPKHVFPLVEKCLIDHRHYVETAVGWVLREMSRVYPSDVLSFVECNANKFSATALTRALEGQDKEVREKLRALRLA